ncbi:MAG: hypothetical protein JSU00_15455 [Acidobacteria bacterium]|nr:hypothetical protein [Acidobacteriota bacterium]
MKLAAIALAAAALLGLFSTQIADTDFWWHLRTGQFIVEQHRLPVPDPFAFTTPDGARFNLTHEWLAQALMYLVYAAGGFPAIVMTRAALLAAICGLAGWLAGRAGVEAGVAAALATASVAVEFTADRPALLTFLFAGVFVAILEKRRCMWALPPIALVWANCHGGFFIGWVVLAAYCCDFRATDRRKLWFVSAISIAVSLVNPNGVGVLPTLLQYRASEMQRNLVEWMPPSLWGPPYGFDILLYAAALVLILARKRVRPPHWILFAAFTIASLAAFRNILLMGVLAPMLIAEYWPSRIRIPKFAAWAPSAAAAVLLIAGFGKGASFQLRAADWTTPVAAADFLLANHLAGPIFNTYEQGGYLIWRLAPETRVFIDGRALSEQAYRDARAILFNDGSAADQITGPRAQLLERYGIQTVVMNAMDYVSGALYPLAIALANPASDWALVHESPQAVVFTRRPPAGLPAFQNKLGRLLNHLDRECMAYIEHSPDTPLCAQTMANYWARNGVADRARRMKDLYLAHIPRP